MLPVTTGGRRSGVHHSHEILIMVVEILSLHVLHVVGFILLLHTLPLPWVARARAQILRTDR